MLLKLAVLPEAVGQGWRRGRLGAVEAREGVVVHDDGGGAPRA